MVRCIPRRSALSHVFSPHCFEASVDDAIAMSATSLLPPASLLAHVEQTPCAFASRLSAQVLEMLEAGRCTLTSTFASFRRAAGRGKRLRAGCHVEPQPIYHPDGCATSNTSQSGKRKIPVQGRQATIKQALLRYTSVPFRRSHHVQTKSVVQRDGIERAT